MKHFIAGIFFLTAFSCQNERVKIGYIENFELYSEFDLTNELDEDLQNYSESRKNEIDSLGFSLEQMAANFESMNEIPAQDYAKFNHLRNTYAFKQKSFEEDLYELSSEYDTQIWDRLNLFISEYAKENEYDFILGATGDGSLMYAKDTTNLTQQLIAYSNSKYQNGE